MRDDLIKSTWDNIKPDENSRRNMLSNIKELSGKRKRAKFAYISVAAALLLSICILQRETLSAIAIQSYYFIAGLGKVEEGQAKDFYYLSKEVEIGEEEDMKIGYIVWHDNVIDMLIYSFSDSLETVSVPDIIVAEGEVVSESSRRMPQNYVASVISITTPQKANKNLELIVDGSVVNLKLLGFDEMEYGNEVKCMHTKYADIYVCTLPTDGKGYYIFAIPTKEYSYYNAVPICKSVETDKGILDEGEYFINNGFVYIEGGDETIRKITVGSLVLDKKDVSYEQKVEYDNEAKITLNLPEKGGVKKVDKDYYVNGIEFHIDSLINKGNFLKIKYSGTKEETLRCIDFIPNLEQWKSSWDINGSQGVITINSKDEFVQGEYDFYIGNVIIDDINTEFIWE